MLSGCILATPSGDLVTIKRITKAEKYRQILVHHAMKSGKSLIGNGFLFCYDNDSKHTANEVKSRTSLSRAGSLTKKRNKRQPTSKESRPKSSDCAEE